MFSFCGPCPSPTVVLTIQVLSSYSTVVLNIGIMKVRGFWPKIIIPKPA